MTSPNKEVFKMFFSIHADKAIFATTARKLTVKLFNGEFGALLDQYVDLAPSERLNWEALLEELKNSMQTSTIGLTEPKEIMETLSTVLMTYSAFSQALDFYFRCGFSLDEYWDIDIEVEHTYVIEQQAESLQWPEAPFFTIFHMGLSHVCQEHDTPIILQGPLTAQDIIAWYLGEYSVQLLEMLKEQDSTDRYKTAAKGLARAGTTLMGISQP